MNPERPPQQLIAADVKLGRDVQIFGFVNRITIGKNAVIGAGSVVTKDVVANTTVAGNPARILRARTA